MRFWVFRWDTNPQNVTYQTWTRMCGPFATRQLAQDFVTRAEAPTQKLRVQEHNVERFLIWSIEHNAWWRPNEQGYTQNVDEAGEYARLSAEAIVKSANRMGVNGCLIPVEATGRFGERQ